MKFLSIGAEHYSVSLPLIGIITSAQHNYPCHDTLKRRSTNYNTPNLPKNRMRHTNTLTFNTGKIQTVEMDQLAPLSPTLIKYVQNFMGTLLYYSRKVDPTLAAALSKIAARQA